MPVVDHALRAGQEGSELPEAVHGRGGFAAGAGDPADVENDAAVGVVGAGGDEHELGAPGGLAGAFEMQAGVGLGAAGEDLASGFVDAGVAVFGAVERRDHFPVRMHHPVERRMRPRPRAVRVAQAKFFRLMSSKFTMPVSQLFEEPGDRQDAFAGVEVVMPSHRDRRQMHVGVFRDGGAEVVPHQWV